MTISPATSRGFCSITPLKEGMTPSADVLLQEDWRRYEHLELDQLSTTLRERVDANLQKVVKMASDIDALRSGYVDSLFNCYQSRHWALPELEVDAYVRDCCLVSAGAIVSSLRRGRTFHAHPILNWESALKCLEEDGAGVLHFVLRDREGYGRLCHPTHEFVIEKVSNHALRLWMSWRNEYPLLEGVKSASDDAPIGQLVSLPRMQAYLKRVQVAVEEESERAVEEFRQLFNLKKTQGRTVSSPWELAPVEKGRDPSRYFEFTDEETSVRSQV